MKKLLVTSLFACSFGMAHAAGFALYEASARGNAMGGALVGSTRDASAVYYNPANMTETTNVSVMAGGTFAWLRSGVAVDGISQRNLNPGMFCIPHFYMTTPVWGDLFAGVGIYCEDGMGTRYGENWALAGDTVKTTIEQVTLNPNLAYRLTDWWSIAGGLKMSYIYFYNRKHPNWNGGANGQNLTSTLEGDDISLGYNFGTTFKLFESRDYGRMNLGVVYRSQLKHKLEGDFSVDGTVVHPLHGTIPYRMTGAETASEANAKVTLPQSLTTGLNWDSPSDRWHAGAAVTWTQWSSLDSLTFNIPARNPYGQMNTYTLPLGWDDVWRFSLGLEYDVTDDFSVRCGYVYDMDPSNADHGTTMLPGGDRHIIGLGFGYYVWSTLRLDVGYNYIMMEDESRKIHSNGQLATFETENGHSHMLAVSLSYAF